MSTTRELQRAINQLRRNSVHVRFGTVTDTSPLSVTLGAAAEQYVGVKSVGGVSAGDRVPVLKYGADLLVLGGLGDGSGDGNGDGGSFQPLDPQLTAIAQTAQSVADAIGSAGSEEDLLGMLGGLTRNNFNATLAARIEFYGHSGFDVGVYDTNQLGGTPSRLAGMLKADPYDVSIGGAIAAYADYGDPGDGGWGAVFRATENEGHNGPYEPRRDIVFLFYGANDLGHMGPGAYALGGPTMNALEAMVSRVRASTIYEETFTAAANGGVGWAFSGFGTTATQATAPTLYDFSGGAARRTTTVGHYGEITVGQDVPDGSDLAICFRTGENGEGGLFEITKNPGTEDIDLGTHDTRGKNPVVYGGSDPSLTPGVSVFRCKVGAGDTVRAEVTALDTNATIDCAWIEASYQPPLVILPKMWLPYDYSWTGGYEFGEAEGLDDSEWQAMNDGLDVIVELFDENVVTVDLEPVVQRDPECFPTEGHTGTIIDNVHLNEKGHARVANALFQAVLDFGRSALQHASGNQKGQFIRLTPRNQSLVAQNIIQPLFPSWPGLTIRQAKRNITPAGGFGSWSDDVESLIAFEDRDRVKAARIGAYPGANDGDTMHGGGSALGFYTEGLEVFDVVLADFADADGPSRFTIFSGGAMAWEGGSQLTSDGAGKLSVVGDFEVTGDSNFGGSVGATNGVVASEILLTGGLSNLPFLGDVNWLAAPATAAVGFADVYLVVPVRVFTEQTATGIEMKNGGTAAGTVKAALYSANGSSRLAQTTATVNQTGTSVRQQVAFASPYDVTAGTYLLCMWFSSATATVFGAAVLGGRGSSGTNSGGPPTTVTPDTNATTSFRPVIQLYQ